MKQKAFFPVMIMLGVVLAACAPALPVGVSLPDCPTRLFAKQALVFDVVAICATSDVPEDKLRHAANVTAEWLDNDTDGTVDEPRIINSLKTTRPFLIMTATEPNFPMMRTLARAFETRVGQDLSAEETAPVTGHRDASQEEIHHLILMAGWKPAFPEIFSDTPESAIYAQWEQAERQGFYSYFDFTCDAHCKTVEFFYLATAAYLGSAADLHSDEMRLKNREQLAQQLPGTIAIIESGEYAYPKNHWPTGQYPHQNNVKFSR